MASHTHICLAGCNVVLKESRASFGSNQFQSPLARLRNIWQWAFEAVRVILALHTEAETYPSIRTRTAFFCSTKGMFHIVTAAGWAVVERWFTSAAWSVLAVPRTIPTGIASLAWDFDWRGIMEWSLRGPTKVKYSLWQWWLSEALVQHINLDGTGSSCSLEIDGPN